MNPKPCILVVEDNPETLAWMVETLGAAGFSVRPADRGELALRSAQAQAPELILLDIRLPDLDGLEVCRRLKEQPCTAPIPVIFLTGLAEVQDRMNGLLLGAVDYLSKPIQKEELLARVRTQLALSQMRQELAASEERFHLAFELADIGMAMTSPEGRLLRVNESFCRMLGYTGPELLQREFAGLTHPEDVAKSLAAALGQLQGDAASAKFQKRYLHRSGRTVWAEISTLLVRTPAGAPSYFLTQVIDTTEQTLAQETLRRTADLLQQAESIARVGGWEVDLVAGTLFWTDETYRIHDLEPGTYMPSLETAIEFYAPEWRPVITRAVQAAIETGQTFDLELELLTAKGRRVWVHTIAHVLREEGRIVKVLGAFRDITDQKQAKLALDRHFTVLAGILESYGGSIFSVDQDYRYTSFNKAHAAIMRALYGCEINLGQSLLDCQTVAEDRAATQSNLERAMGGQSFTMEAWSGEAGLSRRVFEVTHNPILSGEGTIQGVAVFATDVTEPRQAQVLLQRTSEMLRQSQALAKVGGWEVDLEANSLYWTEETYRIYGLDPATYTPTVESSIQFYAPEWRPVITQAVRIAIETGQNFDLDLELITAAGRRIWVHTNSQVVWRGGRIVRVRGAFQDITEQREARQALRVLAAELEDRVVERTAQLEAANQELETFAYSVSHDLKAPLRAVAGLGQALLEDYGGQLPRMGQEYLRQMRGEAIRMGGLIEDLLNLSRIGQFEMLKQAVDLTQLLQTLSQEIGGREPQRVAQWVIPPGLVLQGDPSLLRILFENLLGNAWKFTVNRAETRIQVRQDPCEAGWTQLTIEDNGVGFNPSHASRLFTPFRRLHAAAEFPGTGIGLAIVRRIVQRHGGSVRASGTPGVGAAFTLRFPEVLQ